MRDLHYTEPNTHTFHVLITDQSLQLENKLLLRDIVEANKESSKNRTRLAEAIKSINSLTQALEEEQKTAALYKMKCEQLQSMNHQLEAESISSKQHMRDKQLEIEDLLALLNESERRLREKTRQAESLTEENKRLSHEISSLSKSCNEFQQEASSLQKQIQDLTFSNRQLLQSNNNMNHEVDIGDEIERKQREEIKALNNRIAWLKQENRMQLDAAEELAKEREQDLEDSKAAQNKLTQDLEAQSRRHEKDKKDWTDKQAKLEDHIVELKDLNDEYQLLHAEAKDKLSKLEADRDALLEQLAELNRLPEESNRFSFRRRDAGGTPKLGSSKVR